MSSFQTPSLFIVLSRPMSRLPLHYSPYLDNETARMAKTWHQHTNNDRANPAQYLLKWGRTKTAEDNGMVADRHSIISPNPPSLPGCCVGTIHDKRYKALMPPTFTLAHPSTHPPTPSRQPPQRHYKLNSAKSYQLLSSPPPTPSTALKK
jgi:hypothetical protein